MDVYTRKAARILIAKFGDDASREALDRQLSCFAKGDLEGSARWAGAVEAIEELASAHKRESERDQ